MKNKPTNTKKGWLGVAAGSVMAMSASVAQAVIVEVEGIAGNDTFATANAGGNTTLTGSIGGHADDGNGGTVIVDRNDVDIWSFDLLAGQTFSSAITYTGLYNPFDVNPIITLYWDHASGYLPVASTDPQVFGTSFNFTPWATGNYFLTVTSDFNQGVDAYGNFQSDFSFLTYQAFGEVVLGTPFDHFHNQSFTTFNYEVTATGAVPVPAAVWLFGSGLLGLVGIARRRKA